MRAERGYSLIELMMVVGLIGVVTAMVIPITNTSLHAGRLRGDAATIRNLVGLAKMRASAQFTRARVYADFGNPLANPPVPGSVVLQVWDKAANAWVNDGGVNQLSTGVSFGFGGLTTPPPNTQVNIDQSPLCTNGLTIAGGGTIANTACVAFNSRGLPVDGDGNLYPRHALYVTGESTVFATTITTTPLIRFWSSPRQGTAAWISQ